MTVFDGITQRRVDTDRYSAAVLERAGGGVPVVFVHGNVSSALFWQPTMLALPGRSVAVDLRGFGASETRAVDATRGVRDFSDDVASVLDAMDIERAHVVGWSMGGGVVLQLLLDRPDLVESVALVSPVSPYGFGGTRRDGSLLTDDGAGTGGGGANPDFVARLAAGDRTDEAPTCPLSVYRGTYVAPGFVSEHEDVWVTSMLSTATGEDNYPGDARASQSWPGFAAGTRGVLNTMSPVHFNLAGIVDIEPKPRILWVRGEQDAIVSDESFFDLNTLGKHEVVPGWPGDDVAPPQPMVSQTRDVLEAYASAGGAYIEVAYDGVGHSAHLERPAEFQAALREHVGM
jgi:pimeloyl-ACP methyl ester carboxylesterase